MQDAADSRDLRVGDADWLPGVFSRGDDVGVLIGGKNVEWFNPVTEVGIDKRADGFR
jgi:hypothetical protein